MGFWESLGPLASVDWCEANYVYSSYVAEWWNSLSSLPIAALALFGFALVLRRRAEPRFLVCYAAVFFVGMGSFAFHGTLLKYAQAADELPMILSGLAFVYTVVFRDSSDADLSRMRRFQFGFAVYGAAFVVAYFTLPDYFIFFILSYSTLVAYLVIKSLYVSFVSAPDAKRKRLISIAAGNYVGGVFALWIPEHLVFECAHPIQVLQLHALFHLTSAVGSFTWVLWALHDRTQCLERRR